MLYRALKKDIPMKNISLFSLLLLTASLSCADASHKVAVAAAPNENKLPSALDAYFEYLDTYPAALGPMGDAASGEIEIIRDKDKIAEIEQKMGRKVGIIAIDKYWVWLNDAVKFPKGNYGIYGRMLWVAALDKAAGVAVMPVLPNGKIPLNRNFRHATRSWEYELPRGRVETGESIHAAAQREVKEETGMQLDTLHLLGNMAVDTGLTGTVVPIFLAMVLNEEEATPDEFEAIAAIEAFTISEIKQGLVDGYITATVEGKPCKIPLRDPFLAFALLQAELQSLLTKE
jgi:ADP-ribose pyrophosphatase